MAKKVRAVLTLQLEAGKASPAPPVGPALGQHGVNIMDFVKAYNERTSRQAGDVIPAQITSAGNAVDSMDIARPEITLVPWPVFDALAICCTGR